ncbi:Zinc finger, PHD-type [Corchorus olitorius]|uniref:Zinc finger, PHD-type n=1 Tax=Corchorus olitorius TaxID=93759 RepID=A0A1R3JQ52_9ROSI|nr:Zinc finger, PHD-type [Corchorus olitorius]
MGLGLTEKDFLISVFLTCKQLIAKREREREMELQHFSHIHPLLFIEDPINENKKVANCSGCGELVSGPSFSCMACGFYLDKTCGEAPSELAHPFHRDHSLNLLTSKPRCRCHFCGKDCENFLYHCSSCELSLHIKCALFLYKFARKKIGDLQIAHIDPLIPTENIHPERLKEAKCFACQKPLLDSQSQAYLSLDSGFYLHKLCLPLEIEINHLSHRQHSLFLQFRRKHCQICNENTPTFSSLQLRPGIGLVYYCETCQFACDIKCLALVPPIVDEASIHQHPLSRCFRQVPFICDACGTSGNTVSYICSTCGLTIHRNCLALPRFIDSQGHHHPLSHKYFIADDECGAVECGICHEEVNKVHGSYYCSECKFVVHVPCAIDNPLTYRAIKSREAYQKLINEGPSDSMDPLFIVVKEIKLGENVINIEIKHFGHAHNLVLSEEEGEYEKWCDGCSLLITTPFYHCLQCDFFLHKSCAELQRKKRVFFAEDQEGPFHLTSYDIFLCSYCESLCSGFAYQCQKNSFVVSCIRCSEVSLMPYTSPGHKHPLFCYRPSGFSKRHGYGPCNACGGTTDLGAIYRCKVCNFNLHYPCVFLPQVVRHRCDEYRLKLTYHEENDYSEYLYCDICEEKRDPNNWFYHCATCDTSAHLVCILKDLPFVKRGSRLFNERIHPQTLVFMQREAYQCPAEICTLCGQPCLDLALVCSVAGCNYIRHLQCTLA